VSRRAGEGFRREVTAAVVISISDRFFSFQKIMSRPELIAPPEIVGWLCTLLISTTGLIYVGQYYGDTESKKYTNK
jgi:hypothetical protein